ncbi:MAG: STAS domain-containing protein [Bryobacteraceae bacterium]
MSCTVTTRDLNNVTIVVLSGRFTMTESPGMIRGTVADLLASGRKRIVLDLAGVTYLDSAAGIGELVSSYTSALKQGAQLRLLRAGKNVDRVLRIVGLHNVFEIYDDEVSAISSFAESSLATGNDA